MCGYSHKIIIFVDKFDTDMDKQPKLMDVMRMRDILMPHLGQISKHIFLNRELGIVHGDHQVFRLIMQQRPPFVINDHRFGIIVKGEGHINLNLVDRRLCAGRIVYLSPGTIINPIELSDDFEIYGFALLAGFPMPFPPGQMPAAFNGQVRDFQLAVTDDDILAVRHFFDTLWHVVHQPDYHRPVVSALIAAIMHFYDALYHRQYDTQALSRSREQTIFNRFIQLVGMHCAEHHQIGYYASRMCLTERYLTTVIRQNSGVTAKRWIDQALIMRIKVELRHTDKTVTQISDDLHFPNPSFFCRYFKRETGMTPGKFREST